ncbi:39S ribosomal protein L12, mitochondrial-like [Panonychus citri]|uniref:39S ribosomal protein L12, mitochondrial-like n=1 Tax=Panonychus citri TaxID=50023 RepID=UPI002307FB3C|nr:39S ribosomal protein L12, mitochondrial-like [Panonychus citri]
MLRLFNLPSFRSIAVRTYSAVAGGEKPLAMPAVDFDPKLHEIVDKIEKLTLFEVSNLNQLLKTRLNIPETTMIGSMPSVSAAPVEEQESDEQTVKAVKSAYTVKLVKFDETKKVGLIKEIKTLISGLNLVQAKKFVESIPQVVKSDLSKDEAEKLKTQLESLGATVSVD